jgi:hypothetical protein
MRQVEPQFDPKTIFDFLDHHYKIVALFATLTDDQFQRLTESGLCADDLTGEARLALLALLPEQADVYETYTGPDGQETQSETTKLDRAQLAKVRLQLCRGLSVSLARKISEGSYIGGPNFTSLDAQIPSGDRVLHSQALEAGEDGDVFSQPDEVEAAEKPYKFNWQDKRLAQRLDLNADEPLGTLVDRIRNLTKIEIYADARIARWKVHSIGTSVDCASLLHALTLARDGVIRPLGPAFVMTQNLEGDATTKVKIAGRQYLARLPIEPIMTDWIRKVSGRGLEKRIAFLPNDRLANALYPNGYVQNDAASYDYPKLTSLPSLIQSRAREELSKQTPDDSGNVPKYDLAQVQVQVFARWILPDGRAVLGRQGLNIRQLDDLEGASQSVTPPLDVSALKEGSAIEISPPDAGSATTMVKTLLTYGFKEVWIDSVDPSVIAAAVQAGSGHVDLVIRPWRAVKNETIANPDIDVVGYTGSQVANLPQGKLNRMVDFRIFTDTFLPSDPSLGQHWLRVLSLIPKSGLRRIIVLDPAPGGYAAAPFNENYGGAQFNYDGHQFSFGSLVDRVPGVNDFGYTLESRLRFLREWHADPVDLMLQLRVASFAPDFQQDQDANKLFELWKTERRQRAKESLSALTEQLNSLPYEVCVQMPFRENDLNFGPTGPQVMVNVQGKAVQLDWVPLGPAYSEDADGNFTYGLDPDTITDRRGCIDFRVSPKDFDRYVKHFFALPKPPQRARR